MEFALQSDHTVFTGFSITVEGCNNFSRIFITIDISSNLLKRQCKIPKYVRNSKYGNITSQGETGLNTRTHTSPKWDRIRSVYMIPHSLLVQGRRRRGGGGGARAPPPLSKVGGGAQVGLCPPPPHFWAEQMF